MPRHQFILISSAVLIAAVFTLTAPMKAADDRNPFALWDRLKTEMSVEPAPAVEAASRVETTSPPAAAETGNIAYFSPQAPTTAVATADQPDPEPNAKLPVAAARQERLSVKKTNASTNDPPSADINTVNATSRQLPEIVEWPEFFNSDGGETQTVSGFTTAPRMSGVVNAGFDDSTQSSAPKIQTTSGDFFEEIGPESGKNPFVTSEEGESEEQPRNPFQTANASREVTPNETQSAAVPVIAASRNAVVSLPVGLVGPQTPTVTLQWQHHGEFTVGQECPCDLIVTNSGRSVVRNVVAEAMLPQDLEVVASEPAPTTSGSSATWTFGELQPGEVRTVKLVVVPSAQGDQQLNAFVRMTGGSASTFTVTEPAVSVEVNGPESLEVGQVAHFSVNVGNPGTGKAQNVAIQAAIPEGLEHRHGSRLTINIGTLNPGEIRRARLTVTGVKGGPHQLAVRAIGDGNLNDQTIQLVSVAEPQLNVGLRGPAIASTGQPAVYELVVVNDGNVDTSNVRAKYRVPEGYEFLKADGGGKLNTVDNTIDWFVGTLDPGQNRHYTVTLRPTLSGATRHQVGVMSELGGVSVAEYSTEVQGSAKLNLTVAAAQPRVAVGDTAVCRIQITNTGGSAAENVGLSCELPTGLDLTDISGPTEYIADSGAVIFRKIPAIEAGESITIVLKATCQRDGSQKVRVRVASDSITDALISETAVSGVIR